MIAVDNIYNYDNMLGDGVIGLGIDFNDKYYG